MNIKIKKILSGIGACLAAASIQAGEPPLIITPINNTNVVAVPSNSTATIQYIVSNHTTKTRTLTMKSVAALTQVTDPALINQVINGQVVALPTNGTICANPFSLAPNTSCVLDLVVNGETLAASSPSTLTSGPVICQVTSGTSNTPSAFFCTQPSANSILSVSVGDELTTAPITISAGSPLALEAGGTGTITISNESPVVTATNITADFTGTALEGQVTVDSTACESLAPGSSCNLSFTAGPTTTVQTSFPISGDNTTTVTGQISITETTLSLNPTTLILPINVSGAPVSGAITVTNNSSSTPATNVGVAGLEVTNITLTSNTCTPSLPAGGTCTLTFTPSNTIVPPTLINVEGTNTNPAPATISVGQSSIAVVSTSTAASGTTLSLYQDDGTTIDPTTGTMTVKNTSSQNATGIVVSNLPTGVTVEYPASGTTCPTLAQDETCVMTFTPGSTLTTGTTVTFQGTDTNATTGIISVSPVIISFSDSSQVNTFTLSPTLYVNNPTGSTAAGTMTVTNLSPSNATCIQVTGALPTGVVPTYSPATDCAGTPSCNVLSEGDSCVITFTPGTTATTISSTFNINGFNTNAIQGTIPSVSLVPISTTASSSITMYSGQSMPITVTNSLSSGSAANNAANITATGLPTGVTVTANTCSSVAPGANCTLTLTAASDADISTPDAFQIVGDNTTTVNLNVAVSTVALVPTGAPSTMALIATSNSQGYPGAEVPASATPKNRTLSFTVSSSLSSAVANIASIGTFNGTGGAGAPNIFANTCVGSLAVGTTCTVTLQPTSVATSINGATNIPANLIITGNFATVTSPVTVLAYGSLYESGYVFATDDSPAANLSATGTLMSTSGPTIGGWYYEDNIPISGTQSPYGGQANTTAIVNISVFHNNSATFCNDSTPSGWYSPAICQWGTQTSGSDATGCVGNPTQQNIVQNLSGQSVPFSTIISGASYWSSTSPSASGQALYELLPSSAPAQRLNNKNNTALLTRCVRQIT